VLLAFFLLPILLLVGGLAWANQVWNKVERVPVKEVLSAGGAGTNILIVGSDSRDGADPEDTSIVGAGKDVPPPGQRADSMLILRVNDGGAKLMSVPRDLFVDIPGLKSKAKINAAYNPDLKGSDGQAGGPARLIQTIQTNLGIPINRYMEVDFVSFSGLVDAIGGITLDVPYPMFDPDFTGLELPAPGPHEFDGDEALRYVRARHVDTLNEKGKKVPEPGLPDINRGLRQQQFLTTLFSKVGGSKNPLALMKAADALAGGIKLDDGIGMVDGMKLALSLRGLNPTPVVLPVTPERKGGQDVLVQAKGAEAAVAEMGAK
jgi:LCP family protein required for cell wall assembly